jgi:Na+/H+-dicarboxylate symporter
MFRLALHWQILIGMAAGSLLGIALNLLAGDRSVRVMEGLPGDVTSAVIEDTTSRTEIRYRTEAGDEVVRFIDPTGPRPEAVPTLEALEEQDAVAARIYRRYGGTLAKRAGLWFERIGGLFLRMLQMVAVPLIVTSLLSGIIGLGGTEGIGRMFRNTVLYYLTTSLLAIVTGICLVNLIRPGLGGVALAVGGEGADDNGTPLSQLFFEQLEALIPSNPLGALVEPDFLSIIAFTIAFAVFAVRVGGSVVRRIGDAASAGFEVMMAMTMFIIRLAPIGVFFLIAYVTATQGASVFRSLAWYVIAVALALAFHACVTLPIILGLVARRHPGRYAKAMSPALLTAFSSASSNGTLPLTLTCVEKRAGISNRTGSFVLPLGATINMDGTALYEAIAVLFIAQLHFGETLPLSQQIVVAITALLASVGAAGIPHAGLVMMVIILQAVGLPVELQGIILAVDRVLDMARTAVNVWSDSCGCAVVEALEPRPDRVELATEAA